MYIENNEYNIPENFNIYVIGTEYFQMNGEGKSLDWESNPNTWLQGQCSIVSVNWASMGLGEQIFQITLLVTNNIWSALSAHFKFFNFVSF